MASHSVAQHLGMKPEDYDREIRRLVPHYDELVDEGMEILSRLVAPEARVLDLGCGTGRLAMAVLARLPLASVVLLEIDAAMLEHAKVRLARFGERAMFVHGSFDEPLPRCDAVVASLSLHHVRELEAKRRVYRTIFESLPEGAPFLNLDASVSTDSEIAKLTFDRWVEAMQMHGIDAATARQHLADWAREEHYFSMHEELDSLAGAGFTRPECFWRKGPLAIYGGRTPVVKMASASSVSSPSP